MSKISDPVERSDEFDKKLASRPKLEEQIGILAEAGKKTRRLVLYLAVSVGVNVALTILLGAFFYNQNVIQDDLIRNKNNIVASCNSGNEFRKSNLKLWEYILAIPPASDQTAEQKQKVDEFEDFVNQTFKLRDCSKLDD